VKLIWVRVTTPFSLVVYGNCSSYILPCLVGGLLQKYHPWLSAATAVHTCLQLLCLPCAWCSCIPSSNRPLSD
jgi:hypothetical protein